jgi:hypothetical protein
LAEPGQKSEESHASHTHLTLLMTARWRQLRLEVARPSANNLTASGAKEIAVVRHSIVEWPPTGAAIA